MGAVAAALTVTPIPRATIDRLFNQALVGNYRGEPYLDVLERLTRLLEAEIQGRLLETAHRRESAWAQRATKRRLTAEERSAAQRVGQQARRQREAAMNGALP